MKVGAVLPGCHLNSRLAFSEIMESRCYAALGKAMANQTVEACNLFESVLVEYPDHLLASLGSHLLTPLIYDSTEAVQRARDRVEAGMLELQNQSDRFLRIPLSQRLEQLHWSNFFLAYQGRDDTRIQIAFGNFVGKLTQELSNSTRRAIRKRCQNTQRIRVGFVSSFFRQCTVGGYFNRWITHLDRSRFETFVYHLDRRHDSLTRSIAAECDRFIDFGGAEYAPIEACGKRILADQPDVLIYPELGMDARTFLLASLRLAPVQCAGWGHPVTSGLRNIDYFLSSRCAEPVTGAEHYREKLLLLDGLGVSYPRPQASFLKRRHHFGLSEDKTLYLCPQSLFKLHPDFDALLARVLAADKEGVLVLFEADHPELTRCFMRRLSRVFAGHALDVHCRVVVLPYLRRPDYLEVNRLCDVMLDPLYWSGGNTSLDALSSGLPIVTFNGQFMRGRQTAAMLGQIGLERLVALDDDDYVNIAYRLAHDSRWRTEVRDQLRDRAGELFDQDSAIASFEHCLLQISSESC